MRRSILAVLSVGLAPAVVFWTGCTPVGQVRFKKLGVEIEVEYRRLDRKLDEIAAMKSLMIRENDDARRSRIEKEMDFWEKAYEKEAAQANARLDDLPRELADLACRRWERLMIRHLDLIAWHDELQLWLKDPAELERLSRSRERIVRLYEAVSGSDSGSTTGEGAGRGR